MIDESKRRADKECQKLSENYEKLHWKEVKNKRKMERDGSNSVMLKEKQ